MYIKQAIEITKKAEEAGYQFAIKDGMIQFKTALHKDDGTTDVITHTDWLTYEEAMKFITHQ